jgi:hypothetical protein
MHEPWRTSTSALFLLTIFSTLSACSSDTVADVDRSAYELHSVFDPARPILPIESTGRETNVIYYETPDGVTYWLRVEVENGHVTPSGPVLIMEGNENLGLMDQTPDGWGSFFARSPNGELNWFKQELTRQPYPFWKHEVVGWGWGEFDRLVGAGNGVLYAVRANGELVWYDHLGFSTGSFAWAGPSTVGWGWGQYKQIFGGGDGVLYAIQENGDLVWWRHNGYTDGSVAWDGPVTIGWGWQGMDKVFSAGQGIIYALAPDGTLTRYRHLTWNAPTATPSWGVTKTVTTGIPNVHSMFAVL